MNKKIIYIISILVVLLLLALSLSFLFQPDKEKKNEKPRVKISFPRSGSVVSNIVMVSGTAIDPDGEDSLIQVYVMLNSKWHKANGANNWNYEFNTYDLEDGIYTIKARAYDGESYSDIEEKNIRVDNPETVESDAHKWAVFVVAANFPKDNESKLGNGGLYLAEDMAGYFIDQLGYATSNIFILFDDGWIRDDNGYGKPIMSLQQRDHKYAVTYGSATKSNVESVISYVVTEANSFDDSEVFLWIFSHGCGDTNNELTGGKLLERSAVFLWDNTLTDKELGSLIHDLKSTKTCVIVDACFSGGFADKTILDFPELFIFNSGIPRSGRVVITGESKFRKGYASTTSGPLFTMLWFEGLKSGEADGFRPFLFNIGRKTRLRLFKDGVVSVEESFYYARYILRKTQELDEYNDMEPQINDDYPKSGIFGNKKGLILG